MGMTMIERLYLCPNCFNAREALEMGAPCEFCGHSLLECKPGAADDPCRKPLMDADGDLLTRAPKWWVEHYKRLAEQESIRGSN
jgi:hypothetical protein